MSLPYNPFISVAPNGARKTQADLPQIPITPEELAEEAWRCAEAGAHLFHLHVRDDNQKHSLDPQRYQAALKAIRDKVGNRLILQVTTEAVGMYTPAEQMATVKALVPEAVSMGIRELVPDEASKSEAQAFFTWLGQQPTQVQFICYSADDLQYLNDVYQEGIIPKPSFVLFVLGTKTGVWGKPENLHPFLDKLKTLPFTFDWAVCAFGGDELACMLEAVKHGGHVRIGFENNHLLADGTVAPHNAALIEQFKKHL